LWARAAADTYYGGAEWNAGDKMRPQDKLDSTLTGPQIKKDLITVANILRPFQMAQAQLIGTSVCYVGFLVL
jgi:hypothetical protein